MALGTFIAGRYSCTYNAVSVGITKDGYDLSQQAKGEVLNETDSYGETTLDWVYRGSECFLQFTSREYMAGSLSAFWPYGSPGFITSAATPIGLWASSLAKSIILTSTANTSAAAAPASLTATGAILAPNYDARLLFDSRIRNVPVRLQLLPYMSTNLVHYSTT